MNKEDFITERTRIISNMLDNPDNGIYPTTKCFEEFDKLYDRVINEATNGSAADLLWMVVQSNGDCSGRLLNEIDDYFKSRVNV